MSELEVQKIVDAMARMQKPEGGVELTVFAVLVIILIVAVVVLFLWLRRVTERSEARGISTVKEVVAALAAIPPTMAAFAKAMERLEDEVRGLARPQDSKPLLNVVPGPK